MTFDEESYILSIFLFVYKKYLDVFAHEQTIKNNL